MNRKYFLKNRKRFYLFVMIMSIALSFVFVGAAVNGADTNPAYTTVTVKLGDTLWGLAKEYNKAGDIRKYIHKIEMINNINDSIIYEGDIIKLPL